MIICPFENLSRYETIIPGLNEAVEFIKNLKSFEPATYPLSGTNKVLVQNVTTKAWETSQLEAHREYLDIQYILDGNEVVGWAPLDSLTPVDAFNTEKDKGMYAGNSTPIAIRAGYCYIVYPEDAHAPSVHLAQGGQVKKIVVKLKV